jgi:hypothetical protein
MYFIANSLSSNTLLANGPAAEGALTQLPDNQWILETNYCEYAFPYAARTYGVQVIRMCLG